MPFMTVNISKAELTLLGYLHEHAEGYDVKGQFPPTEVAKALDVTDEQVQRATSFLKGYNLVGTLDTHSSKFHGAIAIWLTQEGENMMRKVEADLEAELLNAPDYQQSVGVRITTKAAGWLMDTAKGVVIAVVAKAITGG
jgi:hypothetical protein